MSATVTTPVASYRVIFRPARDGKPFRVERRNAIGNGWRFESSFGTLLRAQQQYPDARVDSLAEQQQRMSERQPHALDDRTGSGECWRCGRSADWPAHTAGGKR